MEKIPASPSWVRDGEIVAIGGPTSMFNMISVILMNDRQLTLAKVETDVVPRIVAKTSEELSRLGDVTQLELLVGKVALFVAIWKKMGWGSNPRSSAAVVYKPCVGSCFGILLGLL